MKQLFKYFFIGKTLYTQDHNFIDGITRKIIFSLCKKNKIKVIEKKTKLERAQKIPGLFITALLLKLPRLKKQNLKI